MKNSGAYIIHLLLLFSMTSAVAENNAPPMNFGAPTTNNPGNVPPPNLSTVPAQAPVMVNPQSEGPQPMNAPAQNNAGPVMDLSKPSGANKAPIINPATQNRMPVAPATTTVKNTKTVSQFSGNDIGEENRRLWNLQNVDIRVVIEQVARETGKSFIIDPAVTGEATIISNKELSPDELYQVFLSVLQVLGFTAVPSGDVIKIVPDASARYLGLPLSSPHLPGDEFVVSVIPAYHVSVAAMVPVLRNLVSQQGHLAAYAPSNVIIIADRESNVQRMTEVIERIDREEIDGVEVVPLQYATAEEVVNALQTIIDNSSGTGATAGQIALSADNRTNTVIMSGDKTQRLKMRAIIVQLDSPEDSSGNTEVIYLRYQRAEDLVPVLSNVLSSYFGSLSGTSSGTGGAVSMTQQSASRSTSGMGGGGGSSSGSASKYSAEASFGGFTTPERQATGTVIGPYGVQAEPNMNALIITAPSSLMRSLKSVIARLDVRRAQVLVEAVVAEVSADRTNEFGIEWRGGGAIAGGVGWADNGGPGLLDQYQANLDSGSDTLPGSGLTVGIIHEGSLRFLLHALTTDSTSNVLATPSVIAMDNAEAVISVGEAIPFQTGSYVTPSNSSTEPFNTIEYREVGLQLVIKPQISQGDTIQLDIMQRVDTVGSPTATDQPTTHNRMITTRVMVTDGDILVLGGLIQTEETDAIQKVPVLGDIPFIGKAFQNISTSTTRTNLMIFIRPTIVRTNETSAEVTKDKYNFMREQRILGNVEQNTPVFESRFAPWQGQNPNNLPLPDPFE